MDIFFLFQVDTLIDRAPRKTFIEISVDTKVVGYVILLLDIEGYFSQNFIHQCTGDLGSGYADAFPVGHVKEKSRGSYLQFQSVKSVFHINWEKEKNKNKYKTHCLKAGDLVGRISDDKTSIEIIIDDYQFPSKQPRFGKVVFGFEHVKRAIELSQEKKKNIFITNSGLIGHPSVLEDQCKIWQK